jgi:hypothetical protein
LCGLVLRTRRARRFAEQQTRWPEHCASSHPQAEAGAGHAHLLLAWRVQAGLRRGAQVAFARCADHIMRRGASERNASSRSYSPVPRAARASFFHVRQSARRSSDRLRMPPHVVRQGQGAIDRHIPAIHPRKLQIKPTIPATHHTPYPSFWTPGRAQSPGVFTRFFS